MGKARKYGNICYIMILVALVLSLLQGISISKADSSGFLIDANGVLTGYSGGYADVVVPDGVKAIGDYAFAWNNKITSVSLPSSVTSIGLGAFSGCISLTSISIPKGVTSFKSSLFYGCSSLTSITIPEGVTYIGHEAFRDCNNLSSVAIPESVTSIGFGAFQGCRSLTGSISIPEGVTLIQDNTFLNCSSLSNIIIPSSVTSIGKSAFSGCFQLESITIPKSVTVIGKEAFNSCIGLKVAFVQNGVTTIMENAFSGCRSLMSISIPRSVTSIGKRAFYACTSLTKVSLPEGITAIDDSTFSECVKLSSVNIPKSVSSIGVSAFSNCRSLVSVELPSGITIIPEGAFYTCKSLSNIAIPSSVTEIGESAFFGCETLESITIPAKVKMIGASAFERCFGLTNVIFEDSSIKLVTGTGVFAWCSSISEIALPGRLEMIEKNMFDRCSSLTEVYIQEGVTTIDSLAFNYCKNLAKITIPKSVIVIAGDSFTGCSNELTFYGKEYTMAEMYAEAYQIPFVILEATPEASKVYAISGCNVNLSDKINLIFYYDIDEAELADVYAVIGYATENNIKKSFASNLYKDFAGNRLYGIECLVAAKEINDCISIQLFDALTDEPCSDVAEYSVKQYCESLLEQKVPEEGIIKALLSYGTYAQLYFGYNLSDLAVPKAEAFISSQEKVREYLAKLPGVTYEGSLPEGINYCGNSLVLNSSIAFRMYFDVSDETVANTYGLRKNSKNGLYYLEDVAVSITQLKDTFAFQVGDAVVKSCPLTYIQQVVNEDKGVSLTDLCIAIFDYYSAAKDYSDYINSPTEENETPVG